MSRTEIIDKLKSILSCADENHSEIFSNCTESSKLVTDLGFTSVSTLFMVIAIEEVFAIRFENVSASDFVTLGDVVDYIEAKLK